MTLEANLPWLSVVGIGEDGPAALAPAARALIDQAEVLVGGERHLAMVPDDGRDRLTWTNPLMLLIDEIERRRGQRICVLATGDPLSYGIGVTLAGRFPIGELIIVPALSAFSLAAARLGWNLAAVETLTLHGRPLSLLHAYLQPDAKLMILSEDGRTPEHVAALLSERGYGASEITVLEHMGGSAERCIQSTADDWPAGETADLNIIAVACVAGPGARLLPRAPGLPDDAFRHDGGITKREVRAATLAALAPVSGQLLWDVGAGAGSIAIEWMRAAPRAAAVAVERNSDRLAMIAANATALGTPRLQIVAGAAPEALADLASPDAVFVGGGATTPGLIDTCWQALRPGGRLVANAVTLEGEQALVAWAQAAGGSLIRLAVSRATPVGSYTGWQPFRPVTQLAATKP